MKSKFSHLPVIEWKERPQKGARREDAFYLNGERITDDEALRHWDRRHSNLPVKGSSALDTRGYSLGNAKDKRRTQTNKTVKTKIRLDDARSLTTYWKPLAGDRVRHPNSSNVRQFLG